MRVTIDQDRRELIEEGEGGPRVLPLYSPEAFAVLSRHWLTVGWTQKYSYSFTWLGRPLIQLPEDVLRIKEVIHGKRKSILVPDTALAEFLDAFRRLADFESKL